MMRSIFFAAFLAFVAAGSFLGDPGLKSKVARLSCTNFLSLKPTTPTTALAYARGHLALWWAGGNREVLADNCSTYPQKPMASYLGWQHYLAPKAKQE